MNYLYLFGGLIVLIIGANFLVNGAVVIAKKFNLSDLTIGLTIVAIGTSMPEFVVSMLAAINGNTAIVMGNIVGSNMTNILLILGSCAIIYPILIEQKSYKIDFTISILVTITLILLANNFFFYQQNQKLISWIDGIVLSIGFLLFLYHNFKSSKVKPQEIEITTNEGKSIFKPVSYLILGIAGLYFGGEYFVNYAVIIAKSYGMSEHLIGLTIVAIGTSMPEFVTSIIAAIKKNNNLAFGNILGSNVLNILFIAGGSSLINPLSISKTIEINLYMLLFVNILLVMFIVMNKKKVLNRIHGFIFILLYGLYLAYEFSK